MIQIDMEMPKDCEECPLCHRAFDGNETRLACYGLGGWCLGDERRLDNCPLHEVTDVDTISRQATINAIQNHFNPTGAELSPDLASVLAGIGVVINTMPPSPSRPTGYWMRMSDLNESEDDRYKCSYCGNVVHHRDKVSLYTYNSWCGACGANMNAKNYVAYIQGN